MPGTGILGKLFFKKIFRGFWQSEAAVAEKQTDETNTVEKQPLSSQEVPVSGLPARCLVVRKIIRRERLRRRVDFVALLRDQSAAASTRTDTVFLGIRRDDLGSTGGQTVNQPSIGSDAHHPGAPRTRATLRCRGDPFLFAGRS
jgi:hypothetical protein